MRSREEMVKFLTDEIVNGSLRDRKFCLVYVLDVMGECLIDDDAAAALVAGDSETRADILMLAEKDARRIVNDWLAGWEGQAFVTAQMEREAEEEREES